MKLPENVELMPAGKRAKLKEIAEWASHYFRTGAWVADHKMNGVCQGLQGWILLSANLNFPAPIREMLLDYVAAVSPDVALGTLALVEALETDNAELTARLTTLEQQLADKTQEADLFLFDKLQAEEALAAATARATKAEGRAAELEEQLRPGSPTERAPTVWAYEQVCKALEAHKKQLAILCLPQITENTWQLCLKNGKQFREAVGYAAKCGVPTLPGLGSEDEDWKLEFCGGGLWASLEVDSDLRQVTLPEFKKMCDAFSAPAPLPSSPAAAPEPADVDWFPKQFFTSYESYQAAVNDAIERIKRGEIQPREPDEDEPAAAAPPDAVLSGQHYQHYKGTEYVVLCVAKKESDATQLEVVYSPVEVDETYTRPLAEFCAPRFVLLPGPRTSTLLVGEIEQGECLPFDSADELDTDWPAPTTGEEKPAAEPAVLSAGKLAAFGYEGDKNAAGAPQEREGKGGDRG